MEPAGRLILEQQVRAGKGSYRILVREEDLSRYYPHMVRYTTEILGNGEILARVRTNSYEYSPAMPFQARQVAEETAARWERKIHDDPDALFASFPATPAPRVPAPAGGVVIIQGSPRPGGNCAILASWAAEAAHREGEDPTIFFPHDLDIHPCIGCYQCYNTGTCVFQDDMTTIIDEIAQSRLVVICSPVYTNTVPAGLKALLDRFQALHAERTLGVPVHAGKGMLMAVAGRTGVENFRCVSEVIRAFFSLLGITQLEPMYVDGLDEVRDIRGVPGLHEQVVARVRSGLTKV